MLRTTAVMAGLWIAGCVSNDASPGSPATPLFRDRAPARARILDGGGAKRDRFDAAAPRDAERRGATRDADEHGGVTFDAAADTEAPPHAGVDVLTQHDDAARTGANIEEAELDSASVGSPRFGKLFARDVDDEVYAQPLLVSGLEVSGRRRNVLFVATVNDTLYAFDADDPDRSEPLWTRSFLSPGVVPPRNTDMTGACGGFYQDFDGNIGIVSTPVIERETKTLYAVARTNESGKFVQKIHAVNLVDGTERAGSPVSIAATVTGTADGATAVTFDPLHENQRAALLLANGVVYVAWAGHCDWGPYHGWLIGYDAKTLAQSVVYNVTPNGNAGGIWQSGQGPASDGRDLFVITGNGTIGDGDDPRSPLGRGESFLKLRPTGSTLKVESFFTPHDYRALETADLDLGSGGLLLVPGTRLGVGAGKAGILYVVDLDDMGGLTTSKTADDNVVQTFPVSAPNRIAGSPVFWNGPDGARVYVWGEGGQLEAFPFLGATYTPGATVLDVAHRIESAITEVPAMPGAMLTISASGARRGSGVVWASHSRTGSANQHVRPGILRAMDAETLHELWNSRMDPARDDCGDFAKFAYPSVANGKVYLASFSRQVCVYGLSG